MKRLPKRFLDRILTGLAKLALPLFILFMVSGPTWGQPAAPGAGFAARPGTVQVPNLVGQNREQVPRILDQARLHLGEAASVTSDQPRDTVVRQAPAAGQRVPAGTPVRIWVSTGPPQPNLVRVPNIIQSNAQQARQLLAHDRLRLGRVSGDQSMLSQGTIIRQAPTAGQQVRPDTAVDIWVSMGPVQVPNVVGINEPEARRILAGARLRLEVADQVQGPIERQVPAAGESAPMGSSVQVWRRPAGPTLVEVPPLIGRHLDEVTGILNPRNLGIGQVTRRQAQEPAGTIIEQNPAAGTQVQPRIKINLVVSIGAPPPLMEVPPLIGRHLNEAGSILNSKNLGIGQVTRRQAQEAEGTIIGQDPAAGTPAQPRMKVNLVVSTGQRVLPLDNKIPPNIPWLLITLTVSGVLGGTYVLYRIFKAPSATLAVRVVPGKVQPEITADSPSLADLEVRLRPVIDQGQQSITATGSLISEERKEHE